MQVVWAVEPGFVGGHTPTTAGSLGRPELGGHVSATARSLGRLDAAAVVPMLNVNETFWGALRTMEGGSPCVPWARRKEGSATNGSSAQFICDKTESCICTLSLPLGVEDMVTGGGTCSYSWYLLGKPVSY